MMTALALALKSAGVGAAEEALERIAIAALAANPRNMDGAKDAVFNAVRSDARLLWELVARYRDRAVTELLTDAAGKLRREAGGGQVVLAQSGQRSGFPAESFEGEANEAAPQPSNAGRGRHRTAPKGQGLGAPSGRPTAARGTSGMAAVGKVATLSLLDTFQVNGRPIKDVTPKEVFAWSKSRNRDARFGFLMASNLPLDQPIGKFRTAEDAAALYKQAQEEADAE